MRKWQRGSLRTRLTMMAAAAVALMTLILLAIVIIVWRVIARDYVGDEVLGATRWVASDIEHDVILRPLPTGRIKRIQIVDERGRVVTSSAALTGMPPMAGFVPRRPGEHIDREVCSSPIALDDCLRMVALAVDRSGRRWVVYAAAPAYIAPGFALILVGCALVMIALNAFLTYRTVSKTLAPVNVIRSELAEITATDLGRRVTVPKSLGEIEALGHTVNRTLDLLEGLVEQQRRFASDASHDLRSPLTAMRAQVEEALLAPGDTDWPVTAQALLRSVDRLQAIVTDLLMIARLDAGAKQARDLVDLAGLVRTELDRRPRKVPVQVRLEPGVVVTGDPLRLTRVLTNLLDNAERHARSQITISVRGEPEAAALEVLDDGAGIPPEQRELVFQRFTRLDAARSRDTGGTGLGLSIARQLAEAHGGTLTIEDSPGGARFVLRIPV